MGWKYSDSILLAERHNPSTSIFNEILDDILSKKGFYLNRCDLFGLGRPLTFPKGARPPNSAHSPSTTSQCVYRSFSLLGQSVERLFEKRAFSRHFSIQIFKTRLFWPQMPIFHQKHFKLSTEVVLVTLIDILKARPCRPIGKLSSFRKL